MRSEVEFTEAGWHTTILAVVCLLNAGRPGQAETVLRQTGSERAPELYRLLLARARAAQGAVLEALELCLDEVPRDQVPAPARKLAAQLLSEQAAEAVSRGDWERARTLLARVLEVDPACAAALRLMATAENGGPLALLRAGSRNQAIAHWEAMQHAEPGNGRVAHSLALAYRFWAESCEAAGDPERAGPLWAGAIRNWALLGAHEQFWAEWVAERASVYPLPEGSAPRIRAVWNGSLPSLLQRLADDREAEGRREEARRLREWEMRCWVEECTGLVLRDLQITECFHCGSISHPRLVDSAWHCGEPSCSQPVRGPAHRLFCGGPLLLEHLGALQEARELADRVLELPAGKELAAPFRELDLPFIRTNEDALTCCLSERAVALALLTHDRDEEALSYMSRLSGIPNQEGLAVLRLYASLRRGKQLASALQELPPGATDAAVRQYLAPAQEALVVWQDGLARHRRAHAGLEQTILDNMEALAIRVANRLLSVSRPLAKEKRWVEEMRLLSGAIQVVSLAHSSGYRERLAATLTQLHIERGLSEGNHDSTLEGATRAVQDMEAALRYSPDDAAVRLKAAPSFNHLGCEIEGEPSVQAFTRAIEMDPDYYLYRWNRGLEYLRMDRLEEAAADFAAAEKQTSQMDEDKRRRYAGAVYALGRQRLEQLTEQCERGRRPGPEDRRKLLEPAISHFEEALRLLPGNESYQRILEATRRYLDHWDAAAPEAWR